MLQRQVPDRESLEFGVAGLDAALKLVIHLRQAGCHFAGIGAGAGHDHDRLFGFDIGVCAVALAADDGVEFGRISLNRAVGVDLDAAAGKLVQERAHRRLVLIARDHDSPDLQSPVVQVVDGAHGVGVVGDAEIGAHFTLFDVPGENADDDVDLVLELLQQLDFRVGVETGKDARGVEIADQFAAELQIELVAELGGPFQNRVGLFFQILLAVETRSHKTSLCQDAAN